MNFNKTFKNFAAIAAAAVMLAAPLAANAVPSLFQVRISDGGVTADMVITDNGAGDSSAVPGGDFLLRRLW